MVAVINDPKLEKLDFFLHIARAFGLSGEFTTKGQFLLAFRELLLEQHYRGKRLLLIVDECQLLSHDLLEEIRLFSNLEQNGVKLINIFFVGQLEFNDILLLPENKAIKQRITVTYNLPPLSLEETGQYIEHRLTVAGATKKIFEKNTIPEIFEFSKGYPRLINVICDRALLTGFISSTKQIDKKIIQECVDELDISSATKARQEIQETGEKQIKGATRQDKSIKIKYIAYLALVIILFILLYRLFGPPMPGLAPAPSIKQDVPPQALPQQPAKTAPPPVTPPPAQIPEVALPPRHQQTARRGASPGTSDTRATPEDRRTSPGTAP